MSVDFIAVTDDHREWNRSLERIKKEGAIGSLRRGIEIETHGVRTRIVAWPGNGFQTQSLHVLTLSPGESSTRYHYPSSEEQWLCLKGVGEIEMRGSIVRIEPGDLAYFPEGVPHRIANPKESGCDLVVITQISQPPVQDYAASGFYDVKAARFDLEKIEAAKKQTTWADLDPAFELAPRDSHPEVRPWNLSTEDIRRGGALFCFHNGAAFGGLGIPMRLLLWPPYGTRTANIHSGYIPPGAHCHLHTHPISDEILVPLSTSQLFYVGTHWVEAPQYDVLLAPCGVTHGNGNADRPGQPNSWGGGFACPPQIDLYMQTEHWTGEDYSRPEFSVLS